MEIWKKWRHIASLVALLAVGCISDYPTDAPVHPVELSADRAYAGASLTIRSQRFEQLRDLEIWLDTIRLSTSARAADSIVVQLPKRVRGRYSLQLGRRGITLGQIEIAGYVARRPIQRALGPYLQVWPEGGRASVIAGSWNPGDLIQVIPVTGAAITIMSGVRVGDGGGARTPGRTPDSGVLLLQRMSGPLEAWRVLPSPQYLRTLPEQNFRHFAEFNDSTYFLGFHHRVETRRSGSRGIYEGTYEETHEVIISPAGDRATLRVNGSATGPPVFNTATGDTAYHVRQLLRSYGAAFSQDGDTLWMLGAPRHSGGPSLVMMNSRSGDVYKEVFFDSVGVNAMRRDPAGGRLFIFVNGASASPVDLLVVDDRTLEITGHAEADYAGSCEWDCRYAVVAAGLDGVFVVTPLQIFQFDYLD